jgi:hypothetical protein
MNHVFHVAPAECSRFFSPMSPNQALDATV